MLPCVILGFLCIKIHVHVTARPTDTCILICVFCEIKKTMQRTATLVRIKYQGLTRQRNLYTCLRNNRLEKCDQMSKERSSLAFTIKLCTNQCKPPPPGKGGALALMTSKRGKIPPVGQDDWLSPLKPH